MDVTVTDHPTVVWTAQQLRNAFPDDKRQSYLLHDRDAAFVAVAGTIAAMQIQDAVTAPRSPWQNAYVRALHRVDPTRMPRSRACLE